MITDVMFLISCLDSHSRGANNVMLHFSKSVPTKKQTPPHFEWTEGAPPSPPYSIPLRQGTCIMKVNLIKFDFMLTLNQIQTQWQKTLGSLAFWLSHNQCRRRFIMAGGGYSHAHYILSITLWDTEEIWISFCACVGGFYIGSEFEIRA